MKCNRISIANKAQLTLVAALLSACSSAPSHFYTLAPLGSVAGVTAGGEAPVLAVTAVSIPGTLDRPQMVRFASGTRVDVLEQSRWSEPLGHAIAATLAEDLSRRLDNAAVAAYPQDASARARYRISVDVSHLDVGVDGSVLLDAIWTIHDTYVAPVGRGGVPPAPVRSADRALSGHARISEPASDAGSADAAVAAQSLALAQLADQLAQAYRQFQTAP